MVLVCYLPHPDNPKIGDSKIIFVFFHLQRPCPCLHIDKFTQHGSRTKDSQKKYSVNRSVQRSKVKARLEAGAGEAR